MVVKDKVGTKRNSSSLFFGAFVARTEQVNAGPITEFLGQFPTRLDLATVLFNANLRVNMPS